MDRIGLRTVAADYRSLGNTASGLKLEGVTNLYTLSLDIHVAAEILPLILEHLCGLATTGDKNQ